MSIKNKNNNNCCSRQFHTCIECSYVFFQHCPQAVSHSLPLLAGLMFSVRGQVCLCVVHMTVSRLLKGVMGCTTAGTGLMKMDVHK